VPLYTYKCKDCGLEIDRSFPVNNFPREVECIACGRTAKKILSVGHGGIQTDGDVKWLASACDTLLTPGEPRLTTRTEWRACLKKKGLIPIG